MIQAVAYRSRRRRQTGEYADPGVDSRESATMPLVQRKRPSLPVGPITGPIVDVHDLDKIFGRVAQPTPSQPIAVTHLWKLQNEHRAEKKARRKLRARFRIALVVAGILSFAAGFGFSVYRVEVSARVHAWLSHVR